ncbi:Acetyl-coenzyme A synthetase [Zancudomyces culisetae]|uniref:Acetyl-coenzyme A synthetase n=1 Tax=Zancudomyces culisetae TaxID=1213189 RepID=A0A1R1PZ34_ZANCU|nr:Acetyl-coenzyme A synthetase [Zancudomyces culisetae]|eukprot:OMH86210.1 Acetyl-coenzyme A synthetase [Zancudomyces culisetae]
MTLAESHEELLVKTYQPPVNSGRIPSDKKPWITSMDEYNSMYKESLDSPDTFWRKMASELVEFTKPYQQVTSGSLHNGDTQWFVGGELNVSYNCVDRWARDTPDNVAISFEPDAPGGKRTVTFKELLENVCRVAGMFKTLGLKKGDTVAVYMPMIPETAYVLLACTRLGLVHTVVFAGFSATSLADRIKDANASVIVTSDQGLRGGKLIHTKKIVDEAIKLSGDVVKNVIVFERTGASDITYVEGRDVMWGPLFKQQASYIPPVPVGSEDPMFILYTSGSTGKPKGLVHTTAGYLVGAAMTSKYTFDLHIGDVFCCTADIGWITGHTYVVYGPLALGVTSVIFESVPTFPDASRFWQMVDEHKVTQFYTAPTAIRALRRLGDSYINCCDLSTLRIIGTVGEPINPEAWVWYHYVVGDGKAVVVDTYWQSETGSHIITPLPFATPTKPGSATLPMFGIELAILDPADGKELEGNDVTGVLAVKRSWPSMARTIVGDHDRYLSTYMHVYKDVYFTGDGAMRDSDGYYWIKGRVDDVINVSGHRISTAEIESALIVDNNVSESAVIGVEDEITGQAIFAYVTTPKGVVDSEEVKKAMIQTVRKEIGPIATPKRIIIVDELPKTRSGKIIRRVLRKIAAGEEDQLGDLSTLADPSILDVLVKKVRAG